MLRDLTSRRRQASQPAAIESLLAQIRPMVVRYCRARLGRVSGQYHVADDVAQEVCIAVLSALPRYRDMGRPFASFVFGIASHKVADAMRSAVRVWPSRPRTCPDGPDERPGPGGDVVAYLEAERARALLARLPDHQRELLMLRVCTGCRPRRPATCWACRQARSALPSTGRWPGSVRSRVEESIASITLPGMQLMIEVEPGPRSRRWSRRPSTACRSGWGA